LKPDLKNDLENLRVVLVAPRNPLNIGAAARAMSNFGCMHLRLVNPYQVAFHEARSAVHSGDVLQAAREYETLPEAIADCGLVVGTTSIGNRELQHTIRRLEPAGRLMRAHLAANRVALLFGSEKFGLSNDDLTYCHWLLRIPTREEHGSMNLGQAVAVCLYDLSRRSTAKKTELVKTATSAEKLDRLTGTLIDLLGECGYVHADSTPAKIRRLIRRMNLAPHDTEMWFGMLRQIGWKVKQGRPGPPQSEV
jgi:tRNA/rRNA methyltransferase